MLKNIKSYFSQKGEDSKAAIWNTQWLLFEKAISLPISLVVSIMLARHLGVEKIGQYSYFLSLIFIISPISQMGLNAIVTRELLNNPSQKYTIMGSSFLGRIFGFILSLAILLLYSLLSDEKNILYIGILMFGQAFSSFSIIDYWFQSRVEVKYSVFSRLIVLVICSVGRLILIFNNSPFSYFIFLYAFELTLTGIMFWGFYQFKHCDFFRWKYSLNYTISFLKKSSTLLISGIAAVIYLKIDVIMLSNMRGNEEVGIYAVASRMSEIWYFIPGAIVSSFFPMLIKARRENTTLYYKKIQRLCDTLFTIALSIVIPVLLMSRFVVELLYGVAFSDSAAVLNIHILAGMFIFMRALLSKWLIAEELLLFSLYTQGGGALINVIMNYLLIPHFGAMGAAYATLISYTFASYVILFFSSRTRVMAFVMSRSIIFPVRKAFQLVFN